MGRWNEWNTTNFLAETMKLATSSFLKVFAVDGDGLYGFDSKGY